MSKHIENDSINQSKIYFLCNEEQRKLLPNSIHAISTQVEFNQTKSNGLFEDSNCLGIIVLLELIWKNKYYTDCFGFEIIYRLRVINRSKLPIILTSNYPKITQNGLTYDSGFSKVGFRYLRDPALKFINLTELLGKTFKKISSSFDAPIKDELLAKDLQENLYKKQGYLTNFFHKLVNEVYAWQEPVNDDSMLRFFKKQLNELNRILYTQKTKNKIENLISSFFEQEKDLTKNRIIKLVNSFKEVAFAETSKNPYPEWTEEVKVLYIGDHNDIKNSVSEKLDQFGIECINALNSEDAMLTLEEEEINVIISDFRMYSKDDRFSNEQGYHVLKSIYTKKPNIYYPIIFSSYDTKIIQSYFDIHNRPTIIKKSIIIEDNLFFARFAQLIIDKDARIKEEKIKLPDFGKFMHLYVRHITSPDYQQVEKNISSFALKFLKAVQENADSVPHLDNLSGGLSGQDSGQNLENFRMKLKARRVALGLCQVSPSNLKRAFKLPERWSVIYSLLRFGAIDKRIGGITILPFINKHLMKMQSNKSYRWEDAGQLRLTPKEKEWLIKYGEAIEFNQI